MSNEIFERLREVSPDGILYGQFFSAGCNYYRAVVLYRNAEFIHSPHEIMLNEDVRGTYRKLEEVASEVNMTLRAHNPPLPEIPTDREELSALVSNLMTDLFQKRRL